MLFINSSALLWPSKWLLLGFVLLNRWIAPFVEFVLIVFYRQALFVLYTNSHSVDFYHNFNTCVFCDRCRLTQRFGRKSG